MTRGIMREDCCAQVNPYNRSGIVLKEVYNPIWLPAEVLPYLSQALVVSESYQDGRYVYTKKADSKISIAFLDRDVIREDTTGVKAKLTEHISILEEQLKSATEELNKLG